LTEKKKDLSGTNYPPTFVFFCIVQMTSLR
jgi:hypothetical protein